MERCICIHGHFYQPPRENAWLEDIELQDSAFPYHDWNERIMSECYAPNATARILDDSMRIERIVNNYSNISFNFGPTLLAWMQAKHPEVYQAIVTADTEARNKFSGHGSALAQAYNHMIMPLANRRDKITQIIWGIEDFKQRFGRNPEGMWLPETAVDIDTLELLASHGILFTILSPYQARRIRKIGGRNWHDVDNGKIDPTRAYQVQLKGRKKISVFFYDGPISQAVAFENLLSSGEYFAQRLTSAFTDARDWNQLAHIATDGESYGHHHYKGEMALAYSLQFIQQNNLAKLTNYGEHLEFNPPTHRVEIHENSSWSCSHGIERWRSDCGCNSGGNRHWRQTWRAPLREALDWLRDRLKNVFETRGSALLKNPWKARNAYISVILDRSPENLERFFNIHATHAPNDTEKTEILKLLEMQRNAMLMYTSCGWFFDEISGIETVQIIQYAARAIQLASDQTTEDIETEFINRLSRAPSNIPTLKNGARIYEKFVKPAMVDHHKACAHYAISSLFESYGDEKQIHSFVFNNQHERVWTAGNTSLLIGRVRVVSRITLESYTLSYAVIHLGDHNINGGIRLFKSDDAYNAMLEHISEPFHLADFPEVIHRIDKQFGGISYTLKNLFRDEQRKILSQILAATMEELDNHNREIVDRYTPLMRFLSSLNVPLPISLKGITEFVLNGDLKLQLESDETDIDEVTHILAEADATGINIHRETIGFALMNNLERQILQVQGAPADLALLEKLIATTKIARRLPFEINLWKVQNHLYQIRRHHLRRIESDAHQADTEAQSWINLFNILWNLLGFKST